MDDLISRQAAIDALGERPMSWTDSDYELGQRNQYDLDKAHLELLPSAQPERKKGEWIFCENETGEGSNTYKCSACGEIQMLIDGTPKENGWAYCPKCGSKMDEEEDE